MFNAIDRCISLVPPSLASPWDCGNAVAQDANIHMEMWGLTAIAIVLTLLIVAILARRMVVAFGYDAPNLMSCISFLMRHF